MARIKDITNQRFGKLIAIKPLEKRYHGQVIWFCRCDCGNEIEVPIASLSTKKSCGCIGPNQKDLTGQRFGRLVALYPTNERNRHGSVIWHCKCDCGNEKNVASEYLKRNTRSCGCLALETRRQISFKDLTGERF